MKYGRNRHELYPSDAQPQGLPLADTNKIREALIAEIYAINGYASHIANSNMTEINQTWRTVMEDEKKHYGMFLNLLRKYDPVEYQKYQIYQKLKSGEKQPLQPYQPNFESQIILNNIRLDIKGEFEAVILYEQHLVQIPYQDIQEVFYAISSEEKEHVEHLTQLLLKYDPDPYNALN
ncbi:MAG TPA: rubrerythrin [Firmicutes bacterium]|jgi:rubrerythrin|nr:rubrerythrin [Bacillota bacterium]